MPDGPRFRLSLVLALGTLLVFAAPETALGYIGPGAGFALLSSFLVLFTTMVVAAFSLLVWPVRAAWRWFHTRHRPRPLVDRLIVVGLDGQDPAITDRLLAEGKLPHFARLAAMGGYHRLRTTFPSVSPVAWSSFSTGTNPGRHNIFDFLDRDRRTYLPVLSTAHIGRVERVLRVGRFRVPLEKPELRLLRKSTPFWTILGEHDVWSTVLRVPVTFPPDRFAGAELSAMSVPDLLGTQGTFLLYTTRPAGERFKEGGVRVPIAFEGHRAVTRIDGPPNTLVEGEPPLSLAMTIHRYPESSAARVEVAGSTVSLVRGRLSDWVTLRFRAAPGVTVSGICRMQVTETDEHFSLYVTPINLDPEKPVMPVSHPGYYATYLAKKIGPYATLGLAEDTWALNEGVTDDDTFLRQAHDIDDERQAMFFAALDRLRRGSLVCVFDGTDRIQHMFWRYLEDGHPAARDAGPSAQRDAIERLYRRNDALVGRVLDRLTDRDVLFVLSDHGFTSFRRGVNLNAWLRANGYLALKPGATGDSEWLEDVDWSATRAFALGLTGLFLNVSGREAQGMVQPGAEADALKAELAARLSGLRDEEADETAINEVFDTATLYDGPYTKNAPDLLVGFNHGYRTSWDSASGVVNRPIFEDNVKAWSGDHCVDPRIVPGVLFSTHAIDEPDPALIDVAPTALRLFSVTPPAHMEGRPLFHGPPRRRGAAPPAEPHGPAEAPETPERRTPEMAGVGGDRG